jgi:hypothetical protein
MAPPMTPGYEGNICYLKVYMDGDCNLWFFTTEELVKWKEEIELYLFRQAVVEGRWP